MNLWTETLSAEADRAYFTALRVTGEPSFAEEAVQEACLRLLRSPAPDLAPGQRRAYLIRTVHSAAVDLLKSDMARRRRQEAVTMDTNRPAPGPADVAAAAETARAARAALAALPAELRLPVSLCCEQDLSHREAAEILSVPEKTVTDRVRRGLEKLQRVLTAAGYAGCAPAGLAAGLGALGVPAAPAGVLAKIQELAGGTGASTIGVGTGSGAAGAAKGGLTVKIGLGIAAAGLVAGATVWAVGGKSGEPAKPPAAAEKKSQFDTPVWHPDARWECDSKWAGTDLVSELGGPRQEAMYRYNFGHFEDPIAFDAQGGPYGLRGYDAQKERLHFIAGSGRGFMDGPFSRARWGGIGYVSYSSSALSPDRRFQVRTDPANGGAVRILDFKEQIIRTALPPGSGAQAMVINSKGEVLVLLGKGRLVTIDPVTAKTTGEITLMATDGLSLGFGKGLALDEKRNRLYASGTVVNQGGKLWHVWYFDLNDGGSFHGVLAGEKSGPNNGYAGPFDGYKGYAEQSIAFGPDDPDRRFIYMQCTDTRVFMRLDLEKRIVAACSELPGNQVMFIEQGIPNIRDWHSAGPIWMSNGVFLLRNQHSGSVACFRRVK
jgi:RNA polymerase sigma-70 factor (ECF subfamily)